MLIQMLPEDIRDGIAFSCTDCPVARAIRRQTGNQCKVTRDRIENPDGGQIITPGDVERFTLKFDYRELEGRTPHPIAFHLPDGFLRV